MRFNVNLLELQQLLTVPAKEVRETGKLTELVVAVAVAVVVAVAVAMVVVVAVVAFKEQTFKGFFRMQLI